MKTRQPRPQPVEPTPAASVPVPPTTPVRDDALRGVPSEHRALAAHVIDGLGRSPKVLSSMYLYDDEGSRLYQKIMRLPEYYPVRAEHGLLKSRATDLVQALAPEGRAIEMFELGSGDGRKTLSLCQALVAAGRDVVYRPMDISAHALAALQRRFARALPALPVQALCGDYFQTWPIPRANRQQVALFLGSNLGNYAHADALRFLRRVRSHLRVGDVLLLGLDLKKDPHTVLAAYNDSQGVTAAFNLNLLRRLNRELAMDFDLERFSHYPTYCPLEGVARSYLVSRRAQVVHSALLQRDFPFAAGEFIYTEQSQKYDEALIASLAQGSGFENGALITDAQRRYALVPWRVSA